MIRVPIQEIAPLVRLAISNWQRDRAPRMGAALAYYMALSLAPTVIIILAVTGVAFGPKAAQGRLVLAAGVFLLLSLIVNTWVAAVGASLSWLIAPAPGPVQTVDWVVFKALPAVNGATSRPARCSRPRSSLSGSSSWASISARRALLPIPR